MMGLTEELRWTAAKLMSVGKLAVDSAVTESLKGGMQVYTIMKGKLKGKIPLNVASKNKQNSVMVEEMQAKLDKMQQDMNAIKQQSKSSTLRMEGQEHPKQLNNEPIKVSLPEVTSHRKIFIRSCL